MCSFDEVNTGHWRGDWRLSGRRACRLVDVIFIVITITVLMINILIVNFELYSLRRRLISHCSGDTERNWLNTQK